MGEIARLFDSKLTLALQRRGAPWHWARSIPWKRIRCSRGRGTGVERIVVQRKPHAPIVTDFVACVGCRAMYWSPIPRPDPVAKRPGQDMTAIGGPDTSAALKRDSADAAVDYRKPGRSGKR